MLQSLGCWQTRHPCDGPAAVIALSASLQPTDVHSPVCHPKPHPVRLRIFAAPRTAGSWRCTAPSGLPAGFLGHRHRQASGCRFRTHDLILGKNHFDGFRGAKYLLFLFWDRLRWPPAGNKAGELSIFPVILGFRAGHKQARTFEPSRPILRSQTFLMESAPLTWGWWFSE